MALIATSAHDSESPEKQAQFRKVVIGTSVMIFNILYYAAPLSTVVKIIKLRDSSSILGQMVVVNLLNAVMWFIYGVALGDFNISVPNGMGIALACIQLLILVAFRKKPNSLPQQDVEMVHPPPRPSTAGGIGHLLFSQENDVYNPHSSKFVSDEADNTTYKYETIHF